MKQNTSRERLLSLLGLARRAGKVEPGFDAATTAAREGKAALLLAAGDISEKTFATKGTGPVFPRCGCSPAWRNWAGPAVCGPACWP